MKVWAALTALMLSIATPAMASSLHATLDGEPMWASYKERFVKPDGRVVDNANKNVSHSEGQGFAMLLAVAADDADTFASVWSFARDKLGVRKDRLFAWRWTPSRFGKGKVSDTNNATDGDLLIAWALLEAADAGFGDAYRGAAMAIIEDLNGMITPHPSHGLVLRPAAFGFSAKEQNGKQVVNPSYWVFPALDRLKQTSMATEARALVESGLSVVASSNHLPADWVALDPTEPDILPARNFGTIYSYNAVRVPLYLAWSGHKAALEPLMKRWRATEFAQVDTATGKVAEPFADAGYKAIAAFGECRLSGRRFPKALRSKLDPLYYPASLHLLSIAALKQKVPQCW
ncbi:MAG: glycosyl hydrolase family 8 [Pseudomonadota bacterium]